MLASVLSYAAFKGNAYYGALLLFVYGLGAGIPLLEAIRKKLPDVLSRPDLEMVALDYFRRLGHDMACTAR